MWKISEIICLGILAGVAIGDFFLRKIPVDILVIGSAAGIFYQIVTREIPGWSIAGGIAVGVLFLFISRITKEGVGYGDSWGIVTLGIFLGFWNLLAVLAGAFILIFFSAVLLLCRKRMSRKASMPFYPFLTFSYLLFLL